MYLFDLPLVAFNSKISICPFSRASSCVVLIIPHVAVGLQEILGLKKPDVEKIEKELKNLLEKQRGKLDNLEFDPSKNVDYDEEMAAIGRDEKEEGEEASPAIEDLPKEEKKEKKEVKKKTEKQTKLKK